MENIIINKEVALRILKTVDVGLIGGLGEPEPGKMCIEAAVNFALGLPHGDNPPCVGNEVRNFKITLNDQKWPTVEDRTKGMRKLAVAQLGSNEIDQDKFLEILGFKCMTTVLPMIVKNALEEDKDNEFVKKHVDTKKLKKALKQLEVAKNFKTARGLAQEVRNIYYASAYAPASASASAYAYAYAYASASAYAYASASAYAYASAYAKKNQAFHLQVLNLIAQCGLDALIQMKSPGVEYLYLCDMDLSAVELGSKGGTASAKGMTPKQRKQRAIKASHSRKIMKK